MTRMRFPALSLGLLVLLAGGTREAAAQSKAIGVVNVAAVLASIPAYVTADSLLKLEMMNYQRDIERLNDSLQAASAAFQQSAIGWPQTKRDAEQKKLQARYDSINVKHDGYLKKIQEHRDAQLGPIEDRVNQVMEGQRLVLGYSMILNYAIDPNPIVALDRNVDITQKVIDALKTSTPAATPEVKKGGGNP